MASETKRRVTLGFSCQSTSTNEMITAETQRSPFDYNVTTKEFILKSLKSHWSPFIPQLLNLQTYKQPVSGIEGIRSDGIFFWHDFHRAGNLLNENWAEDVSKLIERYGRRWERFVDLCQCANIRKQFVITNTQSNLHEFCENDFASSFGISREFIIDLLHSLDTFGARNYCLDLTVRDIEEYFSIQPLITELKEVCSARFCGAMHLPPHSMIVYETGLDLLGVANKSEDISEICGLYDCGLKLERISTRAAIIYSAEKPEGEARIFPGGYIIALSGGYDYFFRATFKDNRLLLSNRHVWTKRS